MMRIFLILAALTGFLTSPVALAKDQTPNQQNQNTDPFEDSDSEQIYPETDSEEIPLPPQDSEPTPAPLPSSGESSVLYPPRNPPLLPPQDYQPDYSKVPPIPTPPEENRAPIETPPVQPTEQQQQETIKDYAKPFDCGDLTSEECEDIMRQRLRKQALQQPAPGDHIMQNGQGQLPGEQTYDQQSYGKSQQGMISGGFNFPFPPPQNEIEFAIQNQMRQHMAQVQAQIANGFASQQAFYSNVNAMQARQMSAPRLIISGELAANLHNLISAMPSGPIYYPHVYRDYQTNDVRNVQIEFFGQASQNMRDLLALNYQYNLAIFPSLFQPYGQDFSVILTPFNGEDIAARDQAILQSIQVQLSQLP